MAGITLDGVSKVFAGGVQAVDNVSLEIGDGEFMVLVGPSGCGKTTILRMVAGLEEVTDGEIAIGDRVVTDLAPKDRDIAMVFQNYALYPHMTVEQNLGFGLKLRKTPKAEIKRRVDDVAQHPRPRSAAQAQAGGALGRPAPARRDGPRDGARAAAFLMDEPLSNLDAKLRVQMRAELARLRDRLKTTTVYVTHDQVEAMTLGDRVAVMRDGVLQQFDTPQNLFKLPGQPVRRGVHRLAGDEPRRGQGRRTATSSSRASACRRRRARASAAYEGRSVILGIRPVRLRRRRRSGATRDLPTISAVASRGRGARLRGARAVRRRRAAGLERRRARRRGGRRGGRRPPHPRRGRALDRSRRASPAASTVKVGEPDHAHGQPPRPCTPSIPPPASRSASRRWRRRS